jgi:hypothetical protein
MNLTPFQGFLAALADSEFSALFYTAAVFQLVVLALGFVPRVRTSKAYATATALSHVLLTAFLVAGFYFATRPVA